MRETRTLLAGAEAPDFCLPSTQRADGEQEKREVCLHDFRGRQPVILTFYGAAFTPV